jgi:Na+/proline symporter
MFRPDLDDKNLLKVGRFVAFTLGLIVIGLAIVFVQSAFGIFNLMMAFFTLFNIPVTVPMAFGLIFRRVPKWSAVAAITWGLIVGATTRYLMGWDIGPQVYLSFVMTTLIFGTSQWTGDLYRKRKPILALISVAVAVASGCLFWAVVVGEPADWQRALALVAAAALGVSLYSFAKLFSRETEEERRVVAEFFKKIDTPIDVATEVYGAGRRQVSTLPLVGRTIMFMGLLVSASFFTNLSVRETIAVSAMAGLLIFFGGMMWFLGKRGERKDLEEIAHVTAHG